MSSDRPSADGALADLSDALSSDRARLADAGALDQALRDASMTDRALGDSSTADRMPLIDGGSSVGLAHCIPAVDGSGYAWCYQWATSLNGVAAAGAGAMYAVGDDGLVLKYSSPTGAAQELDDGHDGEALLAVAQVPGTSPGQYLAVGQNGTVVSWLDGASPVLSITTAAANDLNAISSGGATTTYAVGANATVLEWQGGATWGPVPFPDVGAYLTGVAVAGPADVWVVGRGTSANEDKIWNGASWSNDPCFGALSFGDLHSVWANGPTDVWEDGTFSIAHDISGCCGKVTSTGVTGCSLSFPDGMWGSAAGDTWIADDFELWHTSGAGACFAQPIEQLHAISGTSDTDAWEVGKGGGIAHVGAAGPTTVMSNSGVFVNFVDIWAASASDVWAADSNGVLHHYDGASWTSEPAISWNPGESFIAAAGDSADDIWVLGGVALDQSYVHQFKPSSGSWGTAKTVIPQTSAAYVTGRGIAVAANGVSGGVVTVVGRDANNAPVLQQRDSGTGVWTAYSLTGFTNGLYMGVSALSATDVWAVSYSGLAVELQSGTLTDRLAPTGGGNLSGVYADTANDVWIWNNSGPTAMWRWGGSSWSPAVTLGSSAYLTQVYAENASNVWAAGYFPSNSTGFLEYWNGSTFTAQPFASPLMMNAVGGLAGTPTIWAGGDSILLQHR
jgi:hypothetical protein